MMRYALRGCFTWNTRLLKGEQENDAGRTAQANSISKSVGCGSSMWHVSSETQGCYRISRKKARKEWHKQRKRYKQFGWAGFMMRCVSCRCFTWNTRLLKDEQENDAERTAQANRISKRLDLVDPAYRQAHFTWNISLLQNKQENSGKRMIWANKNDTSELAGRGLWCGTLYVDVSRETQDSWRVSKKTTREERHKPTA